MDAEAWRGPVGDVWAEEWRHIGPAAARVRELGGAACIPLAAACERRRSGETVAFPAAAWIWSAIRSEGTAP